MTVVGRGIRNAFRSTTRIIAIVVILGLCIGLGFVMLVGHRIVQVEIDATLASVGTVVTITPAGAMRGGTNDKYLTSDQLSGVRDLPHVVSLDETLPDRLDTDLPHHTSGPAAVGTTLQSALSGDSDQPVGFVGTTQPSRPANIGASSLKVVGGQPINGTGESDDAMISTTMAKRNNLQVGSTFSAYGHRFTVAALFDSDSASGDNTVIIPLLTEQKLSRRDHDVAAATATADSLNHLNDVTGDITMALGPAADVTSDVLQAEQALVPLNSVKNLSAYSLAAAAAAAAIISFLIMVMMVRERKREIGILKAIGASNRRISYQFIGEALTFSLLGGIAGVLACALTANAIISSLIGKGANSDTSGGPLTGRNHALHHLTPLHVAATVPDILIGLAGIVLISASGSAAATYLITKIQPAEALRSE